MSNIDLFSVKRNFASGQLDSSMCIHKTQETYLSGAKKLFNMIVTSQGTIARRPPTIWCPIAVEKQIPSKIVGWNITQSIGFLCIFLFDKTTLLLQIYSSKSFKKVY